MINKLSVPFLLFAFSSGSWGWEATTTSVSQTLEEPTATWGASVTSSLQEPQLIVPVFTELSSFPADWAYTSQHLEKAPAVSIQTTTSPTSSALFPNTTAPLVNTETSIPSTSSVSTSKTVTQVIALVLPGRYPMKITTKTLIVPALSTIEPTLYTFPIAVAVGNYAMPTTTLTVPASSTIEPTLCTFPIAVAVGNYAMPTATLIVPASSTIEPTLYTFPIAVAVGNYAMPTTTLTVPASSTIKPTLCTFPIAVAVGNYAMPTATPPVPIIEDRGNIVEPASAGQASAEPVPVRGPWPAANKIMRPGYGYPVSEPESPTLAATSNWKRPTPTLRHPHHPPRDDVSSPSFTAVAVAANAAAVTTTITTTATEGSMPSRTPERVEEDGKEAKRIAIAMGVLASFLVFAFFWFWVVVFSIQGLLTLTARGWRMLKRGAASVSGKVRPRGEKRDAEAEEGWNEDVPLPQVPPPAYSVTPKYV